MKIINKIDANVITPDISKLKTKSTNDYSKDYMMQQHYSLIDVKKPSDLNDEILQNIYDEINYIFNIERIEDYEISDYLCDIYAEFDWSETVNDELAAVFDNTLYKMFKQLNINVKKSDFDDVDD